MLNIFEMMFLPFEIWASVVRENQRPVVTPVADIIVMTEAHRLRRRNKILHRQRLGY